MTKETLNKAIGKLAEIREESTTSIRKKLMSKDQWTWYLIEEVAKKC